MKIYHLNAGTGLKGVPNQDPKKKGLKLNFAVFLGVQINYQLEHETMVDKDGVPLKVDSGKSLVAFRFHSSKKFCKKPLKIRGRKVWHERHFFYDGIDKTEEELLEWVLNTPGLVANDGTTTLYNAKKVKT